MSPTAGRPRLPTSRLTLLASFAAVSVLNYAFGLTMSWLLAPADFGLLAFAQTVLLIAGLALNSGFVQSLAAALVQASPVQRPALIRGAAIANMGLALVLGAVVVLLYALGPLKAGLNTPMVTALIVLTLPPIALKAVACAGAQAAQRFGIMAALSVVEVVCKVGGGVALVGAGLGADGAIAGFLVGAVIAALAGVLVLTRLYRTGPWGAVSRPALRVAGGMFGALLGMALLLNLDLMALKLTSGPDRAAAVGQYQASSILANVLFYLVNALLPILFVQLARLRGAAETAGPIGEALRLAILLVVPVELALVLAPNLALGVFFPHAYAGGAPALRLLALGNCAVILVAILSCAFQATGRAGSPARILLGVTACEAVVLSVVVPHWHALGAATVFLGAALCALALLSTAYLRAVGPHVVTLAAPWLGRLGIAVGVSAGAVALVLTQTQSHGADGALALGGLCYLACAITLHLLRLPKPKWLVTSG